MSRRHAESDSAESALKTLVATLHPTPAQRQILLETMTRCNRAANEVVALADTLGRARNAELSAALYNDLRKRYALPANLVLHAISKVVQRLRLNPSEPPRFPDHGGLFFQQNKTISWKGPDRVSVSTVEGRLIIPVRFERYQEVALPTFKRGNVGLMYDAPSFVLFQIVEVPGDQAPAIPREAELVARFASQ